MEPSSKHASDNREFCAGCAPGAVREACAGAFGRLKVLKVHWECWSDCNLSCPFCYRTRGPVLDTADSRRLISAVWTAGACGIVFAGGDPSLRRDLGELVDRARALNLLVEIQTNAQYVSPEFRSVLYGADLVGLSLDGATAKAHDGFRHKRGNFDAVIGLLDDLERNGVPVVLRTVVTRANQDAIVAIGERLVNCKNICRWSLLEFSPVGSGYANRSRYELDRARFDELAGETLARFGSRLEIDTYRAEDKVGAYVLVTPDGFVYGTGTHTVDGVYPRAGSVLEDHLATLASNIAFEPDKHTFRYAQLQGRIRQR